ncbi:Glycine cleavage system H protein [Jeotgalicoccus aerolatus]|uniref:Glycine cleavage system H protein n=1 Tax=Jeotgalicoccus aerolatus TaxID=709510 RepID=A0A1G8ZMK2_9STAP|nr:glycine cleavage system protein GcvH [Jeotgalicoccus aerolatus]MBP1951187.1 glycine cleavage system H protein [Jeotgalicoccus aerolatus]NMA80706.1 glycine cleavage system protein GcvH [Jeotgalicoccus aerolatus]CAD2077704.1 Glycine cleavage system H protein [Jeotgalicoccus aerolatus]SDK16339.1 glycine cleavage system H protein [Jeotgalicoccus aerolatus]GGD99547.1 glycine cleavage system H protein [Jeotgalicoccus aerolatus]
MSLPQDLKYSEDHEWIKVDGNTATIGITDFAQSELGDIVFVELPEEGDDISTGDSFGSVESVKTVSELYAPVSGKVVAVNEELEDSPELVNENPYEGAWMLKVEISDAGELDNLLDAAAYQAVIEG